MDTQVKPSFTPISIIGPAIIDIVVGPVNPTVFTSGSEPVDFSKLSFGGDALNEAVALSKLGENVELLSIIGNDNAGKNILSFLNEMNVKTDKITISSLYETGMNTVLVDSKGERYFLTQPNSSLDWLDERDDTLDQLVRDISQLSIKSPTHFNPIEDTANESTSQNKIISWTKHIFAFPSQRKAAECAARAYYEIANEKPFSTVILPTGRSATMIFRAMISVSSEYDGCPFGEAPIMSDTETFGVWSGHETSRTKHINDMLIEPLQLKGKAPSKEQLHLLSGVYTEEDPVKNARKVLRLYPPSIHAVSISPLGEILAYAVGTYSDIDDIIDATPKIVEVGEHSKKYIDSNQPSKSILTVGIGTMMSAEILLILAFDIQKANIVRRLFEGPITAGIPATLLRKHPNSFLITTEKVAVDAGIIDYADTNINVEDAVKWITKE